MRSYSDYLARGRAQHGERFSDTALAQQFVRYYESQERVRVRFGYGEELTGTIGATTGWGPVFLLMRTSRAIGSSYTLGSMDEVIAVKVGRTYQPVQNRRIA